MVTSTNRVIPGPDLYCAGPLALWDYRNIFLPNIVEDQKKALPSDRGAPGTVPHGKSGFGLRKPGPPSYQ